LGVATSLAIGALFLRSERLFAPEPWSITVPLPAVGLAVAALALAGSLVIPGLTANARREALARGELPAELKLRGEAERTTDAEALLAIYTTQQIVDVSLLEGAAFFNGVVFLLEGQALALVVALALLGVLLARFPTRATAESWLDRQSARLDRERQERQTE
jgi:hypothetical protein